MAAVTQMPRDADDVVDAVRLALGAERSIEIVGGGTRRGVGQPITTDIVLDLSSLDRVVLYEPTELVLTVEAGASLDAIEAILAERNQEFAFEPMRPAALLGVAPGGTIGGMIGSGFAGPRRFKAGGVRDHVLGLTAVSGFAESFKAGGRVVKNVTGYDVCKLITGSWGTLAVMTEVTLKVMPKAETEQTLVLRNLDDTAAGKAMVAAVGSPFDVSGAAHVPSASLHGSSAKGLASLGEGSATLLRLEGIDASVVHRTRSLTDLIAPFGNPDIIRDPATSRAIWADIRDVAPFAAGGRWGAWTVWRIVCPPASGAALGQALARQTGGDVIYDWGGGLIWAALPPGGSGQAEMVRAPLKPLDGHAMLVRAGEATRRGVDVFEPQAPAIAALEQRVRAGFDPAGIFNPGRLLRARVDNIVTAGAMV